MMFIKTRIRLHPPIVCIENFMTERECRHLIQYAEYKGFQRSPVIDISNGLNKTDSNRTSSSVFLRKSCTQLVCAIEKRAAEIMQASVGYLESLQVVKYTKGQEFRPHYDYFLPNTQSFEREKSRGGQRRHTIFVYLNDLPEYETGGCTYFPHLKLRIRPKTGRAVFWHNTSSSGIEDERTLHGGETITCQNSVKYSINIWSRVNCT